MLWLHNKVGKVYHIIFIIRVDTRVLIVHVNLPSYSCLISTVPLTCLGQGIKDSLLLILTINSNIFVKNYNVATIKSSNMRFYCFVPPNTNPQNILVIIGKLLHSVHVLLVYLFPAPSYISVIYFLTFQQRFVIMCVI